MIIHAIVTFQAPQFERILNTNIRLTLLTLTPSLPSSPPPKALFPPFTLTCPFQNQRQKNKLDCRPSLQILLDFCCVFAVKPLQLLVEFHVAFIDVVNISLFIKCPSAAVLSSFFNSKERGKKKKTFFQ